MGTGEEKDDFRLIDIGVKQNSQGYNYNERAERERSESLDRTRIRRNSIALLASTVRGQGPAQCKLRACKMKSTSKEREHVTGGHKQCSVTPPH